MVDNGIHTHVNTTSLVIKKKMWVCMYAKEIESQILMSEVDNKRQTEILDFIIKLYATCLLLKSVKYNFRFSTIGFYEYYYHMLLLSFETLSR